MILTKYPILFIHSLLCTESVIIAEIRINEEAGSIVYDGRLLTGELHVETHSITSLVKSSSP